MKITREMLRTDLPLIKSDRTGGCNVVLGCLKRKCYDDTNTYISRWQVSNTVWYCAHADDYEGWIELEDLISVYMPENVLEVEDEKLEAYKMV